MEISTNESAINVLMDTTLSIAFFAGLISFLSPCVLPLIPGYIAYISGTSFNNIKEKEKNLIILKTIFFTLGFSFIFITLGSAASLIGNFFLINSEILRIVAGIIIILFSIHIIGIFKFNFMNRDIRFFTSKYSNNLTFPFIVGAAFAFGWTPCIGPILGSIITLAALEENVGRGTLLLSFYSLGLAVPFIISGVLFDKFFLFSKSFTKYMSIVTKVGGIILLLTGVAILTNQLQVLGFFILENFPTLESIG